MVTRFRVFRVGLCGLLFILALSVETFTVRPIDAQSNQPTLTGWHFYGDYATAEDDPCQQNLPPGGFTLGLDKTACSGGENGGTAAATLDIPPSENNHLVLIRIVCAGGAGCAKALTASGAGEVSLSIDGQTFWSAPCDVNGMCDTLALGDTPEIAFVTTPPAQHRLTLTTSPHLAWPIARIELQWQTTPDKIQGIAYSPYRDCQNPHFGPFPTIQQIHEDMVT
ncbi:MAG: hypothetical protein HY866_16305, partial [Chloroflexi bacterium]|nr:hypothetical protein [Chloroflexota bacterium]